MASYFNLVLDTTGPIGASVLINGNEEYTTTQNVVLSITCQDEDTSGYQVKIWGTETAATENEAVWENYSETKNVLLSAGDGTKTVYVKIRDSVHNESNVANDSIILNSTVPNVTIVGPDVATISKKSGKNVSVFNFTSDTKFVAWKVMVVESISALNDTESNVQIPTDNGSTNTSGTTTVFANTPVTCTIYGEDLESASPGDGTKIVKVFVKSEAGVWSVV